MSRTRAVRIVIQYQDGTSNETVSEAAANNVADLLGASPADQWRPRRPLGPKLLELAVETTNLRAVRDAAAEYRAAEIAFHDLPSSWSTDEASLAQNEQNSIDGTFNRAAERLTKAEEALDTALAACGPGGSNHDDR